MYFFRTCARRTYRVPYVVYTQYTEVGHSRKRQLYLQYLLLHDNFLWCDTRNILYVSSGKVLVMLKVCMSVFKKQTFLVVQDVILPKKRIRSMTCIELSTFPTKTVCPPYQLQQKKLHSVYPRIIRPCSVFHFFVVCI